MNRDVNEQEDHCNLYTICLSVVKSFFHPTSFFTSKQPKKKAITFINVNDGHSRNIARNSRRIMLETEEVGISVVENLS